MSEQGDDIDLAALDDDELVKQMHDDLYDGLAEEIVEGTTILLDRGWAPDRVLADALVEGMRIVGIDFRDGILFVPEVLLVRQRHEGRHGDPAPAARRDRRRADRQDGHRHRQGRHPRHRQEPGGDDDGGRRVRGHRHRHQLRRRQVPRRADRAPARHPRHVGAADDDDAVHEGRHRHAAARRACATTTSCSSVERRSTRSSVGRSGPTRTAATRRSPPRPPRSSSKRGVAAARRTARAVRCLNAPCRSCRLRRPRRRAARRARQPGSPTVDATCRRTSTTARSASSRPSRPILDEAAASGRPVFVAYADCGTGGALDRLLADHPASRAPARRPLLRVLRRSPSSSPRSMTTSQGTFFLTDFLARHFDALVWQGLGLDRHPELRDVYFGNYRRVVLLSQTDRSRGRRRRPRAPQIGSACGSSIATSAASRLADAVSVSVDRRRGSPDAARHASDVVVIMWRDIPAQVNGQDGRERHQVLLSDEVPAGDRPGQAQGEDRHRPGGRRPVAPASAIPSTATCRGRGRGRRAGGRLLARSASASSPSPAD